MKNRKTIRIASVFLMLFLIMGVYNPGKYINAAGDADATEKIEAAGDADAAEKIDAAGDADATEKIEAAGEVDATENIDSIGDAAPADNTAEENAVTDVESFDKEIKALIEENKEGTPSVSISIFGQDEDIYSMVYGSADVEGELAADNETVYEWGSISKAIVWTCVMQLYEEGRLELDKDIREYLPDGFLKNLSFDESVTMLNLMNHNAGFQSPYKEIETDELRKLMPLDDALKETAPAQIYAPGDVVAYSNWGAALAGYIVERVSGMDFADYVNENIFKRVGMEHTAIKPDLSDNEWVAERRNNTHAYYYEEGVLTSMDECRAYIHLYPAGSVTGTLDDMKKFTQAFLCDSKDTPLFKNPDTLSIMLEPTLYYADGVTPRFCHGLEIEYYGNGKMLFGQGGSTTGFTAEMLFDIESKTGFVMMTNVRANKVYRTKIPELIYGKPDYTSFAKDNYHEADFSGHYIVSGGSFETGCFKIKSFRNDRFHVVKDKGDFTSAGGVSSMKQISDHAVILKLTSGEERLYFFETDVNGDIERLEGASTDYIKMSNTEFSLAMFLFITMILSMVVMIILLVVHVIRNYKIMDEEINDYKRREVLMGTMVVLLALVMGLLFLFGVNSPVFRAVLCILATFFIGLMLFHLVVCHIKRSKFQKKFIIMLGFETLCCMLITAGFIYWRIFQFWGF